MRFTDDRKDVLHVSWQDATTWGEPDIAAIDGV